MHVKRAALCTNAASAVAASLICNVVAQLQGYLHSSVDPTAGTRGSNAEQRQWWRRQHQQQPLRVPCHAAALREGALCSAARVWPCAQRPSHSAGAQYVSRRLLIGAGLRHRRGGRLTVHKVDACVGCSMSRKQHVVHWKLANDITAAAGHRGRMPGVQ